MTWQAQVLQTLEDMDLHRGNAVVAGGRVVAELLGVESKDTDVFVFDCSSDEYGRAVVWLNEHGGELVERPELEPSASSLEGRMVPTTLGNWLLPARGLDLIFTVHPLIVDILSGFDLGICQCGWLPCNGLYVLTDACRQDMRDRQITSLRPNPTSRQIALAAKYVDRLGWPQR